MKKTFLLLAIAVIIAGPVLAEPVTPQTNGTGRFFLQFANIYFEVDSTYAGRVSSLKVNNQEILFLNRSYPPGPYWGSSFWLSPEDGRHSGVAIDRSYYTGGIVGNRIVLTSQISNSLTARVIKKYQADLADTSITITGQIVNVGTSSFWRAGWEVTRVMPAGSITFWPTGDTLRGGLADKIVNIGNYSWYSFTDSDPSTGTKFYADGREGWYGHVTGGGVFFAKKYIDIPLINQAPNEAEIEFWLSGDHQYVELENQSAYRPIAPNDTLTYVVKWYLRKVPQGVTVAAGSETLLTYARSVVRVAQSAARNSARASAPTTPVSPRHTLRISTGTPKAVPGSARQTGYNLKGERLKKPIRGAVLE